VPSGQSEPARLQVVLFSGGRGSVALAELVATDPRIQLTVAINGYDDGASTGEVRRFLGDALGPSDFRKNASRLARLRRSQDATVIDFLDRRLPETATVADLQRLESSIRSSQFESSTWSQIAERLGKFLEVYVTSGVPLNFSGASVGNFVFAGSFLACRRAFNEAVDDYCALLGLPAGLIDNVTDGANAFLVALDQSGRVLGSEEAIVDAKRQNTVQEIFLIDRALGERELAEFSEMPVERRRGALQARVVAPALNPRLISRIAGAHLIIYAPGTQHSSLFPSYLTPGLGTAIAANLTAIKLLVTNIQTDAEIGGQSAVDLVDRAVFYLREKARLHTPTPCLITHYLLNDPGVGGGERPYVPLGRLESLEDPRLVRVANFEAGATGRHDATKVLAPFIETFIAREQLVQRVAIVLYETRSINKIAQTVVEMMRGGVADLRVEMTVLYASDEDLDEPLQARLPFLLQRLARIDDVGDAELRATLDQGRYDYVILFESSGMYNGEDIAGLASQLTLGRLDAVWGSRRLSVRDIQESYRLRFRSDTLSGAVSYAGSHLLSLLYLWLYGRYVSDTLSAARAVRTSDALALRVPLTHKLANQYLLSHLLRRRAEMLEVPVQFFAISPERVRRTSVADGLRAVATAVRERTRRRPAAPPSARATRTFQPPA
jgi:2-phospho-L-lactate transferase/gluconeogenesis factor (CofD/UPF0052 family)